MVKRRSEKVKVWNINEAERLQNEPWKSVAYTYSFLQANYNSRPNFVLRREPNNLGYKKTLPFYFTS